MSLIAVELTLDQAEEYFRRCLARNANTIEQKNEIITELIKERKVVAVTETNRSKAQYIEDLAKNRGSVLHIKPEGEQK